ncbi:FkbM family methyltransferase [Dickeya oryzae]
MKTNNSSLSELVFEKRNYFLDTFHTMEKNGYPIILVGAGFLANMILDFLNRQSLVIDCIAVNKKWFKDGEEINGMKIIELESVLDEKKKINYIIAMQYFNDKLERQLSINSCEVLICDPSFTGVNTEGILSREYFEDNFSYFDVFYNQLCDERSKRTLVAFLNQRISARIGLYGSEFEPVHYFPRDLITLKSDEVFIDCGAYNGDSINGFLKKLEEQSLGLPAKIIGFEPDEDNFSQLCRNTAYLPNCYNVKKGVWSNRAILHFSSGCDLNSKITDNTKEDTIELISIDEVMNGDVVTFIKMDVEGSELKALKGAERTIKKIYADIGNKCIS